MYCKNCGELMNDNQAICVQCGVKTGDGNSHCAFCGNPIDPLATVCMNCGMAVKKAGNLNGQDKMVMALICFFLGGFGSHDFYLGYTKYGIIKIVLSLCTGVGGSIWALIDFIRLLTGSISTDANGVELKKEF